VIIGARREADYVTMFESVLNGRPISIPASPAIFWIGISLHVAAHLQDFRKPVVLRRLSPGILEPERGVIGKSTCFRDRVGVMRDCNEWIIRCVIRAESLTERGKIVVARERRPWLAERRNRVVRAAK
jgi:hypothetical protein